MVRLGHGGQLPVAVAAKPTDQTVRLLRCPTGVRTGQLNDPVAVDILGQQLTIGKHGVGHAGAAAAECQIHQSQILAEHQNIRSSHTLLVHTGDIQRRRVGIQPTADQAAPVHRGHGAGQHAAVGHAHLLILPAVELRHRLAVRVGAKHQQAGDTVTIQILYGKARVAAGHQRHRLPRHGVHRHGLHLGADTPAHDQLTPAVAVQVLIVYAVDGGAAALDGAVAGIAVALDLKYKYFQRLFVAAHAEKGQGLLLSVAVQVSHLHRLDIPPAGRRGVLIALCDQCLQLLGQAGVLLRHSRQGKQFLHRIVRETAAGQCRCQQRQQPDQADIPFQTPHTAAPPSGSYSYLNIIPHLAPLW